MHQCPRCGLELDPGREVCPQCGGAVSPEPAGPPVRPRTSADGPLPLRDYLQQGWGLFKQFPGGFIGFTILFIILEAILQHLGSLGGIVSLLINTPLVAGYFVVSARLLQGQRPGFGDFFTGFHFFVPLLLTGLVSTALIILGLILLVAPGVYLGVGYMFASALVVDRRLDFWPAMEASRRTLHPRWFSFFAFLLVIILINLGGLLLLGLGLLVTLPATTCAWAAAYADIFGLQSNYSGSVPRLKE